jgi:hypothetical protein
LLLEENILHFVVVYYLLSMSTHSDFFSSNSQVLYINSTKDHPHQKHDLVSILFKVKVVFKIRRFVLFWVLSVVSELVLFLVLVVLFVLLVVLLFVLLEEDELAEETICGVVCELRVDLCHSSHLTPVTSSHRVATCLPLLFVGLSSCNDSSLRAKQSCPSLIVNCSRCSSAILMHSARLFAPSERQVVHYPAAHHHVSPSIELGSTIELDSTELGTVTSKLCAVQCFKLCSVKAAELFKSLVPQTAHRAVLQAVLLRAVLQYVRHAVLLRAALQPVRRAGRQYVVHRVVVHCHVHRCVLLRYHEWS